MYIILLAYAAEGFIHVSTNEIKSIPKTYTNIDLEKYEGFAPGLASFKGSQGFNLAFGLRSNKQLSPEIATWSINYITRKPDQPIIYSKQSFAPCEIGYKGWNAKGNNGRKHLNCTNAFKNKIKGVFGSEDFRYI